MSGSFAWLLTLRATSLLFLRRSVRIFSGVQGVLSRFSKREDMNPTMKSAARVTVLFSLGMLSICFPLNSQGKQSLLNFRHLEHLTEEIPFSGDTVSIVHVYANYPDYRWTGAAESGPEGIACVDDAARAAVLYLRHHQLSGEKKSLVRAKSLLRFILKMPADDGRFYNFIHNDHSINVDGKTSYKSFGWWAARGLWSMCLGYQVFRMVDSDFALLLRRGIAQALPHAKVLLTNYGKYQTLSGYRVPQWLLYESGADVTSELMIGLTEYYRVTGDMQVKGIIEKLAEGLMAMQEGDMVTYPYALHRSWQTMWHMWGNGQTQALAYAGKVLKNKIMVRSAEREARGFYSRLLVQGFLKEMDIADTTKRVVFDQIAYGVRPMVVGLVRLFEATRKIEYLKMAGLAGSWLFGNNVRLQQMYDPATGRCFDGITDSSTVNKNSGAESTIEALYAILEAEQYPVAKKFLRYRKIVSGSNRKYLYAVYRADPGGELTVAVDLSKSTLIFLEGQKSRAFYESLK